MAVRNDKGGVAVVVAPSTKATTPHSSQLSRSSMMQPQHANGGPAVPMVTPAPSHRGDRAGAAVPTPPLSDKGKGNRDSLMHQVAPPDLAHDLSAGYNQQRRRPKASTRPNRKAPLAVGHGNASTTTSARPKTVDQARHVAETTPVARASPPPRTAHHRESAVAELSPARAESSSARKPDPPLVIEAVRKQEEMMKQLTRKRRRRRMSSEEPLNNDGFDPEIEAILAAERAESVRFTRSRSSSSFSQGSAPTEESPLGSSTSRHGRHSSGDGKQMSEPVCSHGPSGPPCPRESQSVTLEPGCRRVQSTSDSHKADGHETSFVAHTPKVDGVITRHQSGHPSTDEMLAGGVAWPSLGDAAGEMSCQLAARQSLWFPENVMCVAIHPSGSNIAVAVASGRQVTMYYGVGGGGCGGGGGGCGGTHDWTSRILIDSDDNVKVLGMCFAACGTKLVVGGRFAESGVLCRVYDNTTCVGCGGGREGGRTGSGATKWLNLRIESGGCLYSMTSSDNGSTLFTCGWSEDGMVVTVALWDTRKIIGDDTTVIIEPHLLLSP